MGEWSHRCNTETCAVYDEAGKLVCDLLTHAEAEAMASSRVRPEVEWSEDGEVCWKARGEK